MATNTLKTRLLLRNDSLENWESINPVLLKGEVGVAWSADVAQPPRCKVGDGVKTWQELPYATVEVDGTSVVVKDNKLALAGFGDEYVAEDGSSVPFEKGLQLTVDQDESGTFKLKWFKPSTAVTDQLRKDLEKEIKDREAAVTTEQQAREAADEKLTTDLQAEVDRATKEEQRLQGLIDVIPRFEIKVVDELPVDDISESTIYLLRNGEQSEATKNIFDEYVYSDGKWELLGRQNLDLSDYATHSEVDTKDAAIKKACLDELEKVRADLQAKIDAINEELKRVNHNTYVAGDGIKFDEVDTNELGDKTVTISALPYTGGSGITISANREVYIADEAIEDHHIKNLNATKLFLNEDDTLILDGGQA